MERRLAAILVADAVGFSALVGVDEERTIRALKAHLSVLEPIVARYSGRIFKTTGDGFLAEFASETDAVTCAAALQIEMKSRNAGEDPAIRIVFRMGLHAGEVIVDGADRLGDGVNIAARLETLCPEGGVVVSGRVHDDVAGKVDLDFRDLGLTQLRNIADPVHVFALDLGEDAPDPPLPGLPDKPSVAVLPFDNMTPDPEDEYFADGVTEDIITSLSYVPWVFVIARNSTFSYKGLSLDMRRIGRELGVRYILQGSIRRSGNRLRITAQLIDAETGTHLWAKRFDGVLQDIFDLQDEISASVVASVAPRIEGAEIIRVLQKPPDNLSAYDKYLRGQNALHLGRIEQAESWFSEALDLAPDFAKARAKRAWVTTVWHYFGKNPTGADRSNSLAVAREALEQQPDDAEVVAYCGYTIGFLDGNPAYGLELVERATDLCPSFAWAWASSSLLSAFIADADPALVKAARALRLSPRDPFAFRTYIAVSLANIVKGDFEALLQSGDTGVRLNPRPINFHYHRAVALAELGRMDEAAKARDRALRIDPDFSISDYITYCRDEIGVSDALNLPLEAGLRKAGFPE